MKLKYIILELKCELVKQATNTREYSVICSIPGTGQINSALFLGFVGNLNRFSNYKQLNAFIGIDISRYHSGTINKKECINRRGNSYARLVEFEIIRSMLKNQKRIQNHLIDYYYKLYEPPYSKHDLVVHIACANI